MTRLLIALLGVLLFANSAHAQRGRCKSGSAVIGLNGQGPPTCGTDATGGIPSGPSGAIQYDNGGVFGGAAVTGSVAAPANGNFLIGNGSGWTVAPLTGTANQITVTNGAGSSTLSLTGPFTPSTFTAHAVLVGEGTSSIVGVGSSAAGQLLQGAGSSSDPVFTATPTLGVAGATQGTLGLAGATAGTLTLSAAPNTTSSYTLTFPPAAPGQGALPYFANGTGLVGSIAAVATGQVLTSAGASAVPAYSNAPTLTGASPSLTINASTSGNSVLNLYTLASTTDSISFGFTTGTVKHWTLGTTLGAAGAQGAFVLSDVVASANVLSIAPSTDAITMSYSAPALNITDTGSGTSTAVLNITEPGVFSSTQFNPVLLNQVNGINNDTFFTFSSNHVTDVGSFGITVPSTATIYQTNAVAGYVDTNVKGQSAGGSNTVGGYFLNKTRTSNSDIWGLNTVAQSTTSGLTGNLLQSIEADLLSSSAGDAVIGVSIIDFSAVANTVGEAISVQSSHSADAWPEGLLFQTGSVSVPNGGIAIALSPQATGASQNSQTIHFTGTDSGSTARTVVMYADLNGSMTIVPASTGTILLDDNSFTPRLTVGSSVSTFASDIATSTSAPSITAGCTGSGGGVVGTDSWGTITTQTSGAATTCTISKAGSACGTAWECQFTDANASTTPVSYSRGALGTSTAVVDFASATGAKIEYNCFCR